MKQSLSVRLTTSEIKELDIIMQTNTLANRTDTIKYLINNNSQKSISSNIEDIQYLQKASLNLLLAMIKSDEVLYANLIDSAKSENNFIVLNLLSKDI